MLPAFFLDILLGQYDGLNVQQYSFYVFAVVPVTTRTDPGTENVILAECQMYMRRNPTSPEDRKAGVNANVCAMSKLNQVKCRSNVTNFFQ